MGSGLRELMKLYRFLKPYRWKFAIGMIFLLISSGASLMFPKFLGNMVDLGNKGKMFNEISRNFPITALRMQMAIVPQDVFLFGGSIRENIAYGKPNAGLEEIIDAAIQANAWDFIQSFPGKLDTIVGERGIQLSGGQRQRIAIARAVLKNPKILILDEATSSLDSESERLVQEALDKLMLGRTSVVIAHRLATIRNADKIIVLENGTIVEQGTHTELIANSSGLYKVLTELQFAV